MNNHAIVKLRQAPAPHRHNVTPVISYRRNMNAAVVYLEYAPTFSGFHFFFRFGLLAKSDNCFSDMPVLVFLPARLRARSAAMNFLCLADLAGTISPDPQSPNEITERPPKPNRFA